MPELHGEPGTERSSVGSPDPRGVLGFRYALHESGFRHPPTSGPGAAGFTRYAEITHPWPSRRGLRMATTRGMVSLPTASFASAEGPRVLREQLLQRIGALSDGGERCHTIELLDQRVAAPGRAWLGPGLALACAVIYGFQLYDPAVESEGALSAPLVELGDVWRLVTANFLHGNLPHLLLNGVSLWVLGALLERSLGTARAGLVMAASGLGAMGAGLLWHYSWALGASGIVAGIAGGLLVLELLRPAMVPAPWRLPRRLLVGAVLVDGLLLGLIPGIAHAAHGGGLLAGGVVTWAVTPARGAALPSRVWIRFGNAAAISALLLSVVVWIGSSVHPEAASWRRAQQLLNASNPSPALLNNEAWTIATGDHPAPRLLAVAERLAKRAVQATGRRNPNFLDTLAELYFQQGNSDRAIATIDEAIALSSERYYREQRRRFTGERPAKDRPAPPPAAPSAPRRLPPPEGIRVEAPGGSATA